MLLQSGADISVVCRSIPPAGQLEFFETNAIMDTGTRDSRASKIRQLHLRTGTPFIKFLSEDGHVVSILQLLMISFKYLPTIYRKNVFPILALLTQEQDRVMGFVDCLRKSKLVLSLVGKSF